MHVSQQQPGGRFLLLATTCGVHTSRSFSPWLRSFLRRHRKLDSVFGAVEDRYPSAYARRTLETSVSGPAN